jgi:hypothetical protein
MVSDERYGLHRSLVDCFGQRAGDSLFVFVAAALAIASRLLQDRDGLRVMLYLLLAVRTGAPDGVHGNGEEKECEEGQTQRPHSRRCGGWSIRRPEYRKVIAWGWNASKDL